MPQASAVSGAPASAAATGAVSTDTTPIKGETIAISTDLVKVEINTAGGELTHLELLKHKGTVDQKKQSGAVRQ
ncbi:YidC/Oxa1 family insertase periplasmic-domain containing protein [Undibacterium arcticum]